MRKIIIAIIGFLVLYPNGYSQSLGPAGTVSQGGHTISQNTSLSWTIGQSFVSTLTTNNNKLSQGLQQPEVDIRTSNPTSLAICSGSTINIPYTAFGIVDPSNIFIAQLSASNGSFNNPVSIGNFTSTGPGSIASTIPLNTIHGAGYRVRVVSSTPFFKGKENGSDITINQPTLTVTCPGNQTVNPLTLAGTVVTYALPTGTSNCSNTVITQTSGLPSGSVFPIGTTINSFLVTTTGGQTSICTFTVTVRNPYCTTNGNSPKVYICRNGNTQCVSVNALQNFLSQGARLGKCEWYNENLRTEITDIGNIEGSEKLRVFPNPIKNSEVTLKFQNVAKGSYDVQLTNGMGQLIYVENLYHPGGSTNYLLQIKNKIPAGIYLIRVNNDRKVYSEKLLVEN